MSYWADEIEELKERIVELEAKVTEQQKEIERLKEILYG